MCKSLMMVLILIVSHALWAEAEPLPLLDVVLGQKRSDVVDLIHLKNHEVLRGQVINETVSVVTSYGKVRLPLRQCALLCCEGAEFVVAVNYNRFSGVIMDQTIRFKDAATGEVVSLRKGKIQYILFKKDPHELDFLTQHDEADLFIMVNGDLLSGESETRSLTVDTGRAKIPIDLADVKTVRAQGGDSATVIISKPQGYPLRGALICENISVNAELGFTLDSVYVGGIARIEVDRAHEQAPPLFKPVKRDPVFLWSKMGGGRLCLV